jgi:hypothetical protein
LVTDISGWPVDLTFMDQEVLEEFSDFFYFKFHLKVGRTVRPETSLTSYQPPLRTV